MVIPGIGAGLAVVDRCGVGISLGIVQLSAVREIGGDGRICLVPAIGSNSGWRGTGCYVAEIENNRLCYTADSDGAAALGPG